MTPLNVTCFRPTEREQDRVVGSNARGGLRRFWLSHAYLFAPAFGGSNEVARSFLDSLVYRDELGAHPVASSGIRTVVVEINGDVVNQIDLELPAREILSERLAPFPGIGCGIISPDERKGMTVVW